MNTDPQSYILSEADSRAIFEQTIVPAELSFLPPPSTNPNPSRTPLAVLIIGQTGSGKTRTSPLLKRTITHLRGPPAHFIADTYKTYHPSYSPLLSAHPSLASPATGPDARRWLLMAATLAADSRADVLLESAARHPDDFAALARLYRGRGYRVEVVVLAVPAALSRLGVLARYHEGLPEAGPAGGLPVRLTPRGVHDESYKGVLEAAAFVDGEGGNGGGDGDGDGYVVDQVVVVRRDNVVAYADEREDGVWRWGPGVARAVRAERERPLTAVERIGARESMRRLRGLNVPGLESQLEEIEELLKPLLVDSDAGVYAPLRPLSLPSSSQDEQFDIEAGLRLGMI
ncbi:zeta toxin-domain-containing protein [Annulohypoxylon truncatum]|uniref:zeta toxin-domain-containing protein n=1 Tax=Annulohypoxylon truncatum TaxID=327061 RepID=UPI00200763B7|nr:zeta toxin-domain-containing protein [Annulohypoxylon truncatum]KAI1213074.1 zeta toxin-domain-containing protein [Annulohypoxylon truncatum]